MSRNVVIAIIVVLVLIVGAFLLTRPQQPTQPVQTTPVETPVSTESASSATEGAIMAEETVVKITSTGFSPKEITIKAGESVIWMNEDNKVHAVNSAVHPTHQLYLPLNLGNIEPEGSKSLTFPDPGVYKYHDHLNPSLTGSVTVE